MDMDCVDSDVEYDLEYVEESDDEGNLNIENLYYSAKSIKETDVDKSIEDFKKIIEKDEHNPVLKFKALKQIVKIYFKHNWQNQLFEVFPAFLESSKNVSGTKSERCVTSILEHISSSSDIQLKYKLYLVISDFFKGKNERIEIKIYTKLGNIYLQNGDYINLQRVIKNIKKSCLDDSGLIEKNKGTLLLEAYSLEIQMYTVQKNYRKLRELYHQSLKIKSAIPHPLIMGIIRECGAKMYIREQMYEFAKQDFFEAFKNYDECGSPRRITTLKYLVLANMLCKSDINPFDSQEAQPYKNHPQIIAMNQMIEAYQRMDISQFLYIYNSHKQEFLEDQFIRENIEDLLRTIRSRYLVSISKTLNEAKISWISQRLQISIEQTEDSLRCSILKGELMARLNHQTESVVFIQNLHDNKGRFDRSILANVLSSGCISS